MLQIHVLEMRVLCPLYKIRSLRDHGVRTKKKITKAALMTVEKPQTISQEKGELKKRKI